LIVSRSSVCPSDQLLPIVTQDDFCKVRFTRTLLRESMVGLRDNDNAQWGVVSLLAVVRSYCARSIPASACFTHKSCLSYSLHSLLLPPNYCLSLFDCRSHVLQASLTPLLNLISKHPQQFTHHPLTSPSSWPPLPVVFLPNISPETYASSVSRRSSSASS
jgi:hypothetical protein